METLRRLDSRNRFIKRLSVLCAILVVAIVAVSCYLFFSQQNREKHLEQVRTEIEERHEKLGLNMSPNLTEGQMTTIDQILTNMRELKPDSLWISQYEFTVGQWYGVLGQEYESSQKDLPMTDVSYGEIYMSFLDSLSNMTNLKFDLPSAEEWEYAARGGSEAEDFTYVGSNDADEVAWYKDNTAEVHPSNGHTGKDPNGIDLFDMSGNVREICNTPMVGEQGEILWTSCGGDYTSSASEVTVTSRKAISTDEKSPTLGFRIIIRKL